MTSPSASQHPISHLFAQSVTEGSARYWAAHFTLERRRPAVRAALCFGHQMDQLTTVSPEVIAEKSVWWHEELTDCSPDTARHPTTQALLSAASETTDGDTAGAHLAAIVDAMHRHLHGALMSQQKAPIDNPEAWRHYAELRFGTLHELIALASGMTAEQAATLGRWTASLHALGVTRAPGHYTDARFLPPPPQILEQRNESESDVLRALVADRPPAPAANQVLIRHELAWWKRDPVSASPVFSGAPVGLRGMLASWLAARNGLAE